VQAARDADAVLELCVGLGDFVPAGSQLVTVLHANGNVDEPRVRSGLRLGMDRSLDQDVAYGIRMLVDIAERSLAESPLLDPTTAVQALDRLHDCMRQLATRSFPDGRLCDDDGALRVIVPVRDWAAYVRLAFEEIRLAGAGSPQVARRLEDVLEDLLTVVPADRRWPLEEQLAALRNAVSDRARDDRDAAYARQPDRQGIGSGSAHVR
jgi:uncharacterized membrane protein